MWIRDDEFIRGDIPMTKFEIRSLVMAFMDIEKKDSFLDIGGGTGSISVQAAKLGAETTAVEREKEGFELIEKNAEKHGVKVRAVHGEAPEDIPEGKYDKIFIGGSGKRMEEILDTVFPMLENGGIIAATFITLKNLHIFREKLKEFGIKNIETSLIQASRVKTKAEMMIAENPIFIVGGRKIV